MEKTLILILVVVLSLLYISTFLPIKKKSPIRDWNWRDMPQFREQEVLYKGSITDVWVKDGQLVIKDGKDYICMVELKSQ